MTVELKEAQCKPFRIGIWMEYFPDWLNALGQDGISRLIGYVLNGFSGRDVKDIQFVFWGPSFAFAKIEELISGLDQDVQKLCRVRRPSHLNPFENVQNQGEFVHAPRRPLSPNQDLDLHYVQEMVSRGETIYNRGTYEFNVRSDFILTALEANAVGDIDVWYVPAPRFCHCCILKAPIVLAFPDFVYCEFPRIYHPDFNPHFAAERKAFETMAQVALDASTRIITYSTHVKSTHLELEKTFDCDANKVEVIRHGKVMLDLQEWAESDDRLSRSKYSADQVREYLQLAISHDALSEEKELLLEYSNIIPWEKSNYIFFPTALRPYKNILNVVKAIRILKEDRNYPCRLVTTANIPVEHSNGNEVAEYIVQNNLMFDVLSMPSVPNRVLSALYDLATASIAPSFFEGGFPFMITEALSVGTPVIVGNISVAREIFGDKVKNFPFFDVHDPVAIADSIQEICEKSNADRHGLLNEQNSLFSSVVDRSWIDVADDYEAVFRSAAKMDCDTLPHD